MSLLKNVDELIEINIVGNILQQERRKVKFLPVGNLKRGARLMCEYFQ